MAEREKSMFGRLAHDLRGPLAPLQTAAYLLRRGDLPPEGLAELLDIIDRQTSRLGGMVQELADWHCVEQGRLRLREEVTELAVLVGLACDGMQPLGGVDVRLVSEVATVGITGDAQRLVQMFASLLAFAQCRSVDAKVDITGDCSGGDAILSIRYRPRRLAPVRADQADLFTRPEASPFDEGLGWRLMIANAIAQAHGGQLVIDVGADTDTDAGGNPCTDGIRVKLPAQSTS